MEVVSATLAADNISAAPIVAAAAVDPLLNVLIQPPQWFEHLFGFRENGRDKAQIHANLKAQGNKLILVINGASYGTRFYDSFSPMFARRNTRVRYTLAEIPVIVGARDRFDS